MTTGTQVKGGTFRSGVQLLAELHGPQSVEAVLARMSGPCGERLRTQSLLASSWYPIEWQNQLFDALRAELGFKPTEMRNFGYQMALRDFRSVYPRLVYRWK